MPRTLTAYLIDPAACTVTEVAHTDDFRQIYTLIGADCFTAVTAYENGDSIYVDDEGLLRNPRPPMFLHRNYPDPLAGKGLVLGCDRRDGESRSAQTALDTLKRDILFGFVAMVNGRATFVPYPEQAHQQ
jgi:hypothetical protein